MLTPEGRTRLEAELTELTEVQRPEAIAALHDAQEQGDGYESGVAEQAVETVERIERRMAELTTVLQSAAPLKRATRDRTVAVGSTIVVQTQAGLQRTVKVVNTYEIDPHLGYISPESPVGQALMGKRAGETVVVATPGGTVTYTILTIR
jgi:transcription elongation factor GreA